MNKHEIELSETLSATEQENYTQSSANGFDVPDRSSSSDLVEEVLDAHGGYDLWKQFSSVTAKVVSGGFLWGMKGIELDDAPRQMTSHFSRQWTRTEPFGDPNWHMTYTPERVIIETHNGELIAEQQNPRDTFAGHIWETKWTPLQLAYFNGYAMWTYYNLPFILAEPGFTVSEIPSIKQEEQMLRGLKVTFPQSIHTHSLEQDLYFDETGLLRRQDYNVDVAGGARAGHLISDYIDVQGLKFATMRRVYMIDEDGSIQFDKMPVSIDLLDFELS